MTNSPEGLPARAAALDLLHAALSRRAGLDDALVRPPFSTLPPRERGHARALVMAALRRLGPIDRLLDAKLQKPPPEAEILPLIPSTAGNCASGGGGV